MTPIKAYAICSTDGGRRDPEPLLGCLFNHQFDAEYHRDYHRFSHDHHPIRPVVIIDSLDELLTVAEQLLMEYIGERDCLYDSVTAAGNEESAEPDDLAVIREMDSIIDNARAVLDKARGNGHV